MVSAVEEGGKGGDGEEGYGNADADAGFGAWGEFLAVCGGGGGGGGVRG